MHEAELREAAFDLHDVFQFPVRELFYIEGYAVFDLVFKFSCA